MTVRKTKKYAVVDLEATGTGRYAKIIQIGIVLVENGQILQQYETDINPYEPLDMHIQQLTGITDEQLALAPDFGQVAGEIYDLIGDAIFVAHNVSFDANLLAEALFFEGYELFTPRVDTVELAQLFFPHLEKYSLSHLAEYLGLDLEQAHTAIADAQATAQLLLAIKERIAQLPKPTVAAILERAEALLYESRLVIEEVYEALSDILPSGFVQVGGLVLKMPESLPANSLLSSDFQRNCSLLGLEERPAQEVFAQLVSRRLREEGQVHLIEAEAGLGKTYGYLLPLLAESDQQVLVSVPTKLLQEQIKAKEGQALEKTFGVSVASIKAARHYLDLATYAKTLEYQDDNRLLNRCKMHLLVWLCQTETGDLDEIRQWYPAYFDELRHGGHVDQQSLFGEWDFWQRALTNASQSRLVLTNHAFLLHHAGKGMSFLDQSILVVDEAQQLLLVAEDLASQTIDLEGLSHLLQRKKAKATHLLEKRLLEACLFEVEALLRKNRPRTCLLARKEIAELQRHLKELADSDLREVEECLQIYNQFWLADDDKLGEKKTVLQASHQELVSVDRVLGQSKIFCISATLEFGSNRTIGELLGFEGATFDRCPSQQESHQHLYGLTDLPSLFEWSEVNHAAYLAEKLALLVTLKKPILVLFQSVALLQAVSNQLDEQGILHLAQYKHGTDHQLKKAFDKGEGKILLGTGVFWQGVDFISHPQMIQVITRFPFAHPEDSLQQKIVNRMTKIGKSPFWDYSMPMMLLRLRQALGRSKRSNQQESAVIFFDPRLQGKSYSKQVRAYLEKMAPLDLIGEGELVDRIAELFGDS